MTELRPLKAQTGNRQRIPILVTILLTLLTSSLLAGATEPITDPESPIVVYRTEADYDDIKSNLELAITGRGMLITSRLHISEMLERTAADTGLDRVLYRNAESLEFCSIQMSYRMSLAHPANMSTCPLTISLYTTPEDLDHTYLSYRRPLLLGEGAEAEKALTKLLDGIVQESLE